MNIGDCKNQYAEQHRDFQDIVDKKLDAAANAPIYIQAQCRQPNAEKFVQPFHAKHLILNKVPYAHTKTSLSISWTTYQNFLMYCAEGNAI